MKCLKLLGTGFLLFFMMNFIQAQNDTVLKLSLTEAQNYAIENNTKIKNAELDIRAAKLKVWETTAIGLPHAQGDGSFTYNIKLPSLFEQFITADVLSDTTLSPDEIQQAIDDAIKEAKRSTTLDVTVSQLIFSGSYIVGLQTSKIYKNLSNYSYKISKDEVIEEVINSYYNVLIAERILSKVDSVYKITKKSYSDMEQYVKEGLMESVDLDQMKINLISVENSLNQSRRLNEISLQFLKLQLGMELEDELILTDNLDSLIQNLNDDSLLLESYHVDKDPSYKLIQTQENLQKQNLNLKKSEFLPTVSAYYMHHENLNTNAVDFQPSDVVGLSVSIPIFSSGERLSRVSQAKIDYLKAQNNSDNVEKSLKLGVNQARINYADAMENLKHDKENLMLSEKIYYNTLEKHKLGMATSMELSQAQAQFLINHNTYYATLITLVDAKTKLDKAYSNL